MIEAIGISRPRKRIWEGLDILRNIAPLWQGLIPSEICSLREQTFNIYCLSEKQGGIWFILSSMVSKVKKKINFCLMWKIFLDHGRRWELKNSSGNPIIVLIESLLQCFMILRIMREVPKCSHKASMYDFFLWLPFHILIVRNLGKR